MQYSTKNGSITLKPSPRSRSFSDFSDLKSMIKTKDEAVQVAGDENQIKDDSLIEESTSKEIDEEKSLNGSND